MIPFWFLSSSANIKMMVSLILYYIRYVLVDLNRSDPYDYLLKSKLKNLELFVLCARTLGNDAKLIDDGKVSTLESYLQRIHHAVSRNALQIQRDCYDPEFLPQLVHIEEEIDHWYKTLADLTDSLPQPTFPMIDEVLEIIDSVLECSVPMVKRITFFKNFILFVTLTSVDLGKLKNFLIHIVAATVNAAHIYRINNFLKEHYDVELEEENSNFEEENVSDLALKNSGVYETYTQALISSKLSTHFRSSTPDEDHVSLVIMKDFIGSLMCNLWEILQIYSRIAISGSFFQLRLLYESLRLLRSMLTEQERKFDKEMRELTRVLICDAGVIIFSLYYKDVEEEIASIPDDLLQRINLIRQEVGGKDVSSSDFVQRLKLEEVGGNDLPRTNLLGFIDFLLESFEARYGVHSQFQMIRDELSSLRYFLEKIVEVRNEQKELEALWNEGVKVAYKVESLIDQVVFGDFQASSSTSFDSTIEEVVKEIRSINSEIYHASDVKVEKESMTSNLVPSPSSVPIVGNEIDEIVGLDDDAESIIHRLIRGSKQLKVVPIVGMPGIGKTTLATKVFNDRSVTLHFHTRAWCCVSQLFDRKRVLLELLSHVIPGVNFDEMPEQDLVQKLWRGLKGKKYLIVLDDVWDTEVWNSLRTSFPDDDRANRIILTSRHRDVAPLAEEPYFVRQLNDDESWELLRRRLSHGNEYNLELYELGMQIAATCKGLPLTVVVVAGLLANLGAEGWEKVLENISSVSSSDQCKSTLELSYKHLPDYLKPCFLYFGLFPEGRKVSIKRLICLWIAEGFVLKTKSESLEDVARGYFMELVGRSLVIVADERSRGGARTYRIHDLLHEFCRTKAKEENFFNLLEGGYDEFLSFEEPVYMRRLCVHSAPKHFKNLRIFSPRIHSLLFFSHNSGDGRDRDISFIIRRYSRLRVLDIGQYILVKIASEIGVFRLLKYLCVRTRTSDIPSSIGDLVNLETLIVESKRCILLPDTFWKLQKLRHLAIEYCFQFSVENLENFPGLCELQSCSRAVISPPHSIEWLIRKFSNIRRLYCNLPGKEYGEISMPASLSFEGLQLLESLTLLLSPKGFQPISLTSNDVEEFVSREDCRFEFDFPGNLRKLSLWNFCLHHSDISRIGKLPNLEALKLRGVQFSGEEWDMMEGEFPKLIFLELFSSHVRWTQFPMSLQKLVILFCDDLEEIDCCSENVDGLKVIEVLNCSESVNSFFHQMQQEQMEMGNWLPKIHITSLRFDPIM